MKLHEINKTHKEVYEALRAVGIQVNLHYIPIYRMPYYEQMGFNQGYCPQAEKYHSETLSIPMYPGLKESDLSFVVSSLSSILLS